MWQVLLFSIVFLSQIPGVSTSESRGRRTAVSCGEFYDSCNSCNSQPDCVFAEVSVKGLTCVSYTELKTLPVRRTYRNEERCKLIEDRVLESRRPTESSKVPKIAKLPAPVDGSTPNIPAAATTTTAKTKIIFPTKKPTMEYMFTAFPKLETSPIPTSTELPTKSATSVFLTKQPTSNAFPRVPKLEDLTTIPTSTNSPTNATTSVLNPKLSVSMNPPMVSAEVAKVNPSYQQPLGPFNCNPNGYSELPVERLERSLCRTNSLVSRWVIKHGPVKSLKAWNELNPLDFRTQRCKFLQFRRNNCIMIKA